MAAFLDVCRFTPTLGGTTDWVFSAAVVGYATPAQSGAVNGRVYKVRSESADLSQWEISEGAYNSAAGTFARTTVLYNSSGTGTATGQSGAGTKINFSTVPQVAIVAVKEDLISIEEANSFTTVQKNQALANIGAAPAITSLAASLGADVTLNNATYTDGPSVAQGTAGTWEVTATLTVSDSTAASVNINFKLWDGTTIIDSTAITTQNANAAARISVSLSGVITSPAGNLKVSAISSAAATSKLLFNQSSNSKDCTITAIRIA